MLTLYKYEYNVLGNYVNLVILLKRDNIHYLPNKNEI